MVDSEVTIFMILLGLVVIVAEGVVLLVSVELYTVLGGVSVVGVLSSKGVVVLQAGGSLICVSGSVTVAELEADAVTLRGIIALEESLPRGPAIVTIGVPGKEDEKDPVDGKDGSFIRVRSDFAKLLSTSSSSNFLRLIERVELRLF